jgi:hypothetical protein
MGVDSMKTPEDEAFDELAKKQGMWGGGFQAKRAAAADKINADFDEEYIKYRDAFPKDYKWPNSEWNAALDEAAARIGEIKGFGKATQDSFAVYIKGLKK